VPSGVRTDCGFRADCTKQNSLQTLPVVQVDPSCTKTAVPVLFIGL